MSDSTSPPRRSIFSTHPLAFRGFAGVVLLLLVVVLARYFGHKIPEIERWVADLGMWAPLAFLLLLVIGTSLFVPDTLFAIFAGSIFGLLHGSVLMTIGALLTASLNFWCSRQLFRDSLAQLLEHSPRLAAIEKAANNEGLRLLVLLRLTPIHAVSLSYALGASRVTFRNFFLSALAMIPMLVVEVYFGYLATHLAKTTSGTHSASTLHTAVIAIGFVTCAITMLYITRLATKTLGKVVEEDEIHSQENEHAATE